MNIKTYPNILMALSVLIISLFAGLTNGQDWKNQVLFPDDAFCKTGTYYEDPGWVKFTIKLNDPNTVYYQDSQLYPFHYDFASAKLPPFIGMSNEQFDQATLYELEQQASLGAVIMPPLSGYPAKANFDEYGVQFVRSDPYTREEIRDMFNAVKATVTAGPEVQAFYFPTYEQMPVAQANLDWFQTEGIKIGSASRWSAGNPFYSQGWALGKLKFFRAGQINNAYQTGLLEPGDILLTDAIPAELPHVAGIISLSPATPSSHVAILAQTYGIPFVHLAVQADAETAQQLINRTIALSVFDKYGECDLKIIDVENVLTAQQIEEILQLKTPPPLNISPMQTFGSYSKDADNLLPSDIKYFGGKAANFGMLRQSIPNDSPKAIAISFDLWNEFLGQTIYTGSTLRQEIANRLSAYTTYPPSDMSALQNDLGFIRELFKNTYITSFSQNQKDDIATVLQANFNINEKIRFRSSTNVEDSDQFTGAGLYDSYSGCLADDLDSDEIGPCNCDPTNSNERGVFRAVRKVFASFYNDNAFLERLRHNVNESDAAMALLVHHSFPDQIELANGVATLQRAGSSRTLTLVTQKGAISVSNPEPGSIPEEVGVDIYSFGMYPRLATQSSLLPLGAKVMDWEDDYRQLAQLLLDAAAKFEQVTGKTQYVLDFEYKKMAPGGAVLPAGGLVVKQIRQIPQPDTTKNITPFLINKPAEYCLYQGEGVNIFARHRLKSRWTIQTKSTWLSTQNLTESLYADVNIEYVDKARIRTIEGKLPLLPFADNSFVNNYKNDYWRMHHLANPRNYRLQTGTVPTLVSSAQSPLIILDDFWNLSLYVSYDSPVKEFDWQNGTTDTTTDSVSLRACLRPRPGDLLQQRSLSDDKTGISITTKFYWPPYPTGPTAGYTAPLVNFVETVITGPATEPIILKGYYSQTYATQHHNFGDYFLFEPQLEPGISQTTLDQLKANDIRLILLDLGTNYNIKTYGFDSSSFIPGDHEPDGDVDLADLANLAVQWQNTQCDTCGKADLTGDGKVDIKDFAELSLHWLK